MIKCGGHTSVSVTRQDVCPSTVGCYGVPSLSGVSRHCVSAHFTCWFITEPTGKIFCWRETAALLNLYLQLEAVGDPQVCQTSRACKQKPPLCLTFLHLHPSSRLSPQGSVPPPTPRPSAQLIITPVLSFHSHTDENYAFPDLRSAAVSHHCMQIVMSSTTC